MSKSKKVKQAKLQRPAVPPPPATDAPEMAQVPVADAPQTTQAPAADTPFEKEPAYDFDWSTAQRTWIKAMGVEFAALPVSERTARREALKEELTKKWTFTNKGDAKEVSGRSHRLLC